MQAGIGQNQNIVFIYFQKRILVEVFLLPQSSRCEEFLVTINHFFFPVGGTLASLQRLGLSLFFHCRKD